MATVEVGVYSEEEDDEVDSGPEPWGWLFPQNKGFAAQGDILHLCAND